MLKVRWSLLSSAIFSAVLLLSCALSVTAQTFTVVQAPNGVGISGGQFSVSYPQANTAGDLLVAFIEFGGHTSTTATITDTRGNNWQLASSVSFTDTFPRNPQVWIAQNCNAGTETITINDSLNSTKYVYLAEFSASTGLLTLDKTSAASGNSGSLNSGSVTLSSTPELLIGWNHSLYGALATGSGFSLGNGSFGVIDWEYQTASTSGPWAATATAGNGVWGSILLTFSAPPPPPQHFTTLTWQDNVNPPGSVTYNVYRSLGASWSPVLLSNVAATTYTDTTIVLGQNYVYKVTSLDVNGVESDGPSAVTVTSQ